MAYIGRDISRGNYLKLDNIQSQFNGSTKTFNLTVGGQAFYPGSPYALLLSLGGVVQEPNSAFELNGSQVTFATAPASNIKFFCTALSQALSIGVPGNATVDGTKLANTVTYTGTFVFGGGIQNANGNIVEDLYELDDASSFFASDGLQNTIIPKFNNETVSISNPFKLLITVNGVLQSAFVYDKEYVWKSDVLASNDGYTVDYDGNVKFTETIPQQSQIVMKTVSGANKATVRNYPFKPLDIIF
jgi:hypothetical protein